MQNVLGIPALNEKEALANLLDAISIAENAARQMAIYTDLPQWIVAASQFSKMREVCSAMGQKAFTQRLRV